MVEKMKKSGRGKRRGGLCLVLTAVWATPMMAATWDGGDADDDNWTSPDNWTGDVAPGANAPLVFTGQIRLIPVNNFAADTDFGTISFNTSGGTTGAFNLTGNRIDLINGAGIVNSTTVTQTISLDIRLTNTNHVIDTDSGDLVINGAITGSAGGRAFSKVGDGTLTLSGTASNTTNIGTFTASEGTVVLSKSGSAAAVNNLAVAGATVKLSGESTNQVNGSLAINSGTFDLSGQSESVAGISGSGGKITNSAADTNATLTISNAGGNYSGTIEDGAGKVALNLAGGTVTFSGNNTFTGGVNATGATLVLASNSAAGTGNVIAGTGGTIRSNGVDREMANPISVSSGSVNFTNNGNLSFLSLSKAASGNSDWNVANQVVFRTNSSWGGGTYRKMGSGNVIFLGNYSHSGAFEIHGGMIAVAGSFTGSTPSLRGGSQFGRNGTITASVGSNNNSVEWVSGHSGGVFAFGPNATWGHADNNLTLNFSSGTTLTWGSTADFISAGQTLILGHAQSNGTVTFSNPISFNAGTRTVQVNAATTNTGGGADAVLAGKLSNGGLTKTGGGRLLITNATNDYAGGTSVAAGVLEVSGTLGTGNVSVAGGATLQLNSGTAIDDTATLTVAEGGFIKISGVHNESVAVLVLGELVFNAPTVFSAANSYQGFADPGEFFFGSTGMLTVIPEPGCLSLISLAALGALRRRRRWQDVGADRRRNAHT